MPVASQGQQAPVFRTGVDLLALDVTVVDKAGRPVSGLTAADFVVQIDGNRRPVRTLEYRLFGVETIRGSSSTGSSNVGALGVPPVYGGGRIVLLLFDDLSAKPGQAKALLVAAERVLKVLGSDDLIGVATTSGLGPLLSPTRDRAALAAALHSKRLVGLNTDTAAPFFITTKEAVDIADDRRDVRRGVIARECAVSTLGPVCDELLDAAAKRLAAMTRRRAAQQMAAYENAINALLSLPAPRVIIAPSAGIAFGAQAGRTEQENFEVVSRAAADANVQFYALAEAPDTIDIQAVGQPLATNMPYDRVSAGRAEGQYLNDGLKVVAHAAGGEAFTVIGQADRFFGRILTETSAFYVLGIEIPPPRPDQQFLGVKVSVSRAGSTVRTRRYALVPGRSVKSAPAEEALRMQVARGGFAFGVPLTVGTALRAENAGLSLAIEAHVPRFVKAPLLTMFAVVDEAGQVVHAGRREIPADSLGGDEHRAAFRLPLQSGSYRLRVAVADAQGNVGSVQQHVMAQLHRFGTLQTSDLLLTWAGTDNQFRIVPLDVLPAGATTLRATIELYPDRATLASVKVRFVLRRTEDSSVVTTAEVAPSVNGSTTIATAALSATALTPGAYTIEAEVLDVDRVLGVVSALVHKTGTAGSTSRSLR